MRKRKTAIAAGVLAAGMGTAFAARSEYERDCLSAEEISVVSSKIQNPRRMVFLSDLHNKEFGPENQRLIHAVNQIKPDGVLIGGDMMVSKGESRTEVPLKLMKKLASHYPIYYSNGNHENRMVWERHIYKDQYEAYREQLKSMGVIYLENESCRFGDDMVISGVDLDKNYYRKLFFEKPEPLPDHYLDHRLGKADASRFQILLIHSPMYWQECAAWGADLTLSGHFHGGTIRIPGLGGVMTPQYQFFLPWCAGTFEKGGKKMVVSRGLGTHSINIRINNKPQLIVLNLKPKERSDNTNVCLKLS